MPRRFIVLITEVTPGLSKSHCSWADVNKLTKLGTTALVEGANEGHLAVVEKLLNIGANVEIAYEDKTALTSSLLDGQVEICEALIIHSQTNLDMRFGGRITLLCFALHFLSSSTVLLLLEGGVDRNIIGNVHKRCYPLDWVVMLREFNLVGNFLEHGADQSLQDKFGGQPLS